MSETAAQPEPLRCLHYLDAVREEAGGVVRAVLDLLEGLAAAGVEVTLLTGDTTDVPESWSNGGAGTPTAVRIKRSMSRWLTVAAAERPMIAERLAAADVLHLHTPWDRYNVALAAEARRVGLPYIVSAHGMLDHWSMSQRGAKKRLYLSLVGRRMLTNAYSLHCTAEGEERQALDFAPAADGHVLPLVLDLSAYADPPSPAAAREAFPALKSDGPKLLFLSRVHPKKGVERLLRATATLHQRGVPAQAMIAGPGNQEYVDALRSEAARLGVADHTHFLGMVRGETKLSLYQACDVFVLPTSQENFGIVLAEAMASGLPTVTTHGVDIAPELERFGAAIVSDIADGDELQLASAIQGMLDDPTPAESADRARSGVLEWLDPETVINGYIKLYRAAAATRRGGVC